MISMQVVGPDEWQVWRTLRLRALAEAPYAFGSTLADWQGEGDRESRWRDRLGMPGSYNLVALLDGEPVGMASGVPSRDEPGAAELISMWVAPTARGRGVGDALMAAVERWARESGAHALHLDVADGNDAAFGLYRRQGFEDAGPSTAGGRCERLMTKRLDEKQA